ncbi:hypothetical protein [Marinobacter sp.]|uniref:hypothetical protein n=1 Tax=Marinobacter sp. TaxID=50741 RepID=UPI003A95A225
MRAFRRDAKYSVLRFFVACCASVLATLSVAAEQVRIDEVSGQVRFRANESEVWKQAEAGMSIHAPVEFQALAGGSGLLSQSGSEFELKAGSHITLQSDDASSGGLVSKIKQWFGTVFYRIERQPDQFSVETPFMVSTVKGTRFVIVSTKTSSIVTLTEGSLEVLDIASGETLMLAPGDVAGIGAEQTGIQSHKQTTSKPAAPVGAGAVGFEPAMEAEQSSFESQLEGITEIASEQALVASNGEAGGDAGSGGDQGNGGTPDDLGDDGLSGGQGDAASGDNEGSGGPDDDLGDDGLGGDQGDAGSDDDQGGGGADGGLGDDEDVVIGRPPGHGGTPPGHGGTPPGHGGTPPGHGGTPPGHGGTPPGQAFPPGQWLPPGQGYPPDDDDDD